MTKGRYRVTSLLTFEYSSVDGALAAAYTSGRLAAEFGAEQVLVALPAEHRGRSTPLLAELSLTEAHRRRFETRLLAVVTDGDGPVGALLTSHQQLERNCALVVRALSAVLLARPQLSLTLEPVLHNPASHDPVLPNRALHNPASHNPASHNPASHNPASHNPALHNPALQTIDPHWIAEQPLRAASILVLEEFIAGTAPLAA